MKPQAFKYSRADTIEEALNLLSGGRARVLSGGMSLLPLLKLRLAACETLVNISRIPELDFLIVDDDAIRIGAARTVASLIEDDALYAAAPVVGGVLSHVGSPAIRNRATFVGALCHADPAAEALLIALLLDGSLRLNSASGVRWMNVSDFVTGPLVTACNADEIVTEAKLARRAGGFGFRCYAPRPGDYSICAAAVLLSRADSGALRASIVVAGVDHLPVRLIAAEQALEETHDWSRGVEVAVGLCKDACVVTDANGSADYRAAVAASLLEGAIADAAARLQDGPR
jgi:carbon-monoxide dehydrogenase medium subunit